MNLNYFQLSIKSFILIFFICEIKYCFVSAWKFNIETATAIASEDPSTAAKNIVTGAGVAVTAAAVGVCATNFWNPIGMIACAGLGIAGVTAAIAGPAYVAPDWRYVNCSSEEYRSRAIHLISLIPESKRTKSNKFDIILYLNNYCGMQCSYPTRIKPVGGDRCSDGLVNGKVAEQYYKTWKEVLGERDGIEFKDEVFNTFDYSELRCKFSDQINCHYSIF
ncbi:unnamed protein product [Aphis gossypii]|uniref:Uncharacterized protein n=1 Tax=Aphis gossypii TaxID=80765 RepID=A0A9P0IWX0_APHGO|nr:unnamed protein product [Aphis gossypii]